MSRRNPPVLKRVRVTYVPGNARSDAVWLSLYNAAETKALAAMQAARGPA